MKSPKPDALLETLKSRFEQHKHRHPAITWTQVRARLEAHPGKLASLQEMESTGGEPDVIARDNNTGEILFCDCSPQSPAGRRSLCYDPEALNARKENKPKGSALGLARSIGAEILTEEQYRHLQTLGEFDTKTSSWIATPPGIRQLGGALFCDRRFNTVFTYHNGAESYYAARGFRASLRV